MINLITKISNNEKITDKELDELKNLQKQFEDHINERSLSNKKDQQKFLNSEKL